MAAAAGRSTRVLDSTMHRGINTAKRVAIDLFAILAFSIALFVLATAIKEREWFLAGVAMVALLLGTLGSAALCGHFRHEPERDALPRKGES